MRTTRRRRENTRRSQRGSPTVPVRRLITLVTRSFSGSSTRRNITRRMMCSSTYGWGRMASCIFFTKRSSNWPAHSSTCSTITARRIIKSTASACVRLRGCSGGPRICCQVCPRTTKESMSTRCARWRSAPLRRLRTATTGAIRGRRRRRRSLMLLADGAIAVVRGAAELEAPARSRKYGGG